MPKLEKVAILSFTYLFVFYYYLLTLFYYNYSYFSFTFTFLTSFQVRIRTCVWCVQVATPLTVYLRVSIRS